MRITVTGTSRVKVPAECARVAFSVQRRGEDRDGVLSDISVLAQKVRTLLAELTPEDDGDEPHLTGLRSWSEHDAGRELHVARMNGSVTVWQLEKLGEFLARLAGSEGVTVDSVQWDLSQDTRDAVEPEAVRDAYQGARQRARWIAAAAGRGQCEVVAVTDGAEAGYGVSYSMMRDGGAPTLELDPVDVEITASLKVEFTA